jgi:hypothetical protein
MVICSSVYANIKILKIGIRKHIKLLSQLCLHGRFSLTSTSYLARYDEYNLDGQGDIKECGTLKSIVDFQSQSNPIEYTSISKSLISSLNLELESTIATVHSREGVKRILSNKLDSVKKSKKIFVFIENK